MASALAMGADRDDDDLGHALVLETDGLFHRDLVERVHAHLDVRQIDARPVRLHAGLHIVIKHTLDRHQHLHQLPSDCASDAVSGIASADHMAISRRFRKSGTESRGCRSGTDRSQTIRART
jgi:hypothetical protein